MYISEIKIENFRLFGSGKDAFFLPLKPGVTALVGENDAGKTAVVDAIRYVLGTRDQEFLRVDPADFHQPVGGGKQADEIMIKLTFSGLTLSDRGAFSEYLTFVGDGAGLEAVLVLTWIAKRNVTKKSSRKFSSTEWRTGADADGPILEFGARQLLTATYLRPLRDAERAMGAGRGSRLSQILQHTSEITEIGDAFAPKDNPNPDPRSLSVLGLGDYTSYLFGKSEGVRKTREKLNDEYLKPLSFADDVLSAEIGVSSNSNEATRLRQLLEKLEVVLGGGSQETGFTRGLGSNNLLFMACELLLLATESDGFPLLLVEEPEAHLHPQRQLRMMSFIMEQAEKSRPDGQQIQAIVSTHSPNVASSLRLSNLVLIQGGRAFPLSEGETELSGSDYQFLARFLDVTKSNLFFARGVLIVEGDAENILLPAIARLLDRPLELYGVSVVNVGGVGLGRYSRIFMRRDEVRDGIIDIPVACITDMDVMPDNAPEIIGKIAEGEEIPLRPPSRRRWRVKSDFPEPALQNRREEIQQKASGQRVETFVSDEWTLEYDLAFFGFASLMWDAAQLALDDEKIHANRLSRDCALRESRSGFEKITSRCHDRSTLACHVYALFSKDRASKTIAAQQFALLLEEEVAEKKLTQEGLLRMLPPYLVQAIAYVTAPFDATDEVVSSAGDIDG